MHQSHEKNILTWKFLPIDLSHQRRRISVYPCVCAWRTCIFQNSVLDWYLIPHMMRLYSVVYRYLLCRNQFTNICSTCFFFTFFDVSILVELVKTSVGQGQGVISRLAPNFSKSVLTFSLLISLYVSAVEKFSTKYSRSISRSSERKTLCELREEVDRYRISFVNLNAN